MPENTCKEKTFKALFYQYAEEIRNFIYYRSGNLAQAEDLVQEAFAKLWENCRKVPAGKARSFLYTVARNAFLNQVERENVRLKFGKEQTAKDQDQQTPQFILEEKEFLERLEKAIGSLPEQQRVVFLMNRIDKKKYREIAEELGISVKAVEKRMHKALAALRKIHQKL